MAVVQVGCIVNKSSIIRFAYRLRAKRRGNCQVVKTFLFLILFFLSFFLSSFYFVYSKVESEYVESSSNFICLAC